MSTNKLLHTREAESERLSAFLALLGLCYEAIGLEIRLEVCLRELAK